MTPTGTTPELSIVIVSYNARADLEACLDSLAAHPSRLSCEVVVVDNASTDGSAESVAALLGFVLSAEQQPFFACPDARAVGTRLSEQLGTKQSSVRAIARELRRLACESL